MYRTLICLILISGAYTAPAFAGTCSDFLVRHIDRLASMAWIPEVPQEKWELSALEPHYNGEDLARSPYHSELPEVLRNLPIHYYSDEELLAAQVVIRNGLMFRLNGTLVTSMHGMEYVMRPDGEILIMPHYWDPARGDHRLKHSSLANGAPVAASGHISINENGEIIRIDRFSGHYKPSRLQLKQFLDRLKNLGVDLSSTEIHWN
jgi:hypothetical protein